MSKTMSVAGAGGVVHAAYAGPEGAVVLDTFVPIREDFRALAGAEQ